MFHHLILPQVGRGNPDIVFDSFHDAENVLQKVVVGAHADNMEVISVAYVSGLTVRHCFIALALIVARHVYLTPHVMLSNDVFILFREDSVTEYSVTHLSEKLVEIF
jgi:hypothetical protein